jgi:hypothetical protein
VADDRSLGRRILLHVLPAEANSIAPPTRLHRLRLLGSGEFEWQARSRTWHAFAAPAGGPLADMIPRDKTLNWADARLLLEQIVEELRTAESDGTLPGRLSVNQLCCEPGGRLFLLDFPLPSSMKIVPVREPRMLLRQAATMMLEGAPRQDGGPVKAPLPPQATAILKRLFRDDDEYPSLEELQCELAESHAHEPAVTRKMQATHLGVASILLAFPLMALFGTNLLVGFITVFFIHAQRLDTESTIAQLQDPQWRSNHLQDTNLKPLANARLASTIKSLERQRNAQLDAFHREFQTLSRPERFVIDRYVKRRGRSLLISEIGIPHTRLR